MTTERLHAVLLTEEQVRWLNSVIGTVRPNVVGIADTYVDEVKASCGATINNIDFTKDLEEV